MITSMGRQATHSGDLITVNINGKGAAWVDGTFFGDVEIIDHAKLVASSGLEVFINGSTVIAESETANGAYAALYSYNPDQIILVEAPENTALLARVGLAD